MSLNLDGRENKIKLISDTMTGFYSVMRNLQEDYAAYHQNFSEEALAVLSRSGDFIESVEAVRSLDSLSRIDDEGINELFLLSQQIAELYHLKMQTKIEDEKPKTQQDEITSEDTIAQNADTVSNKLNGETDLFTLFVNEVSQEIGEVIHIDEGMRITFRLDALDKTARYKTDWESKKEGGAEGTSFYSLVSLIKNTADDDSMDREMTFEEVGDYKVSAKVYKVMKQSLFSNLKKLVRDYEINVVVDESDDLYATMDIFPKLLKALQNVSWKEVASTSAEEVLKTLPMMVGTIIVLSGVLIAITMTPIGWLIPLVGTAMQVYGGARTAKDIAAGLYLFTDAVIQTKEAKSKGAMDQASALFTKAFKYVGPNLLMDILMMLGGKAIKNVKGANKIEPVKQKLKLNCKNAKSAVGKNINDVASIDGYDIRTSTTGKRYIQRKPGMKDNLPKLELDEDGIIHNIDAEAKKKARKRRKNNAKNIKKRLPRTNGHWEGKPGDGIWFSTKADVKSIVGNEGIPFSNGRPIFSKWKKGSFKFKKGVLNGTKDDFDVVYDKIMQIKGFSSRNKAKLWLLEKKLTPHHKSLLEIELIPTGLHGNIPHIGSASDLRG